MLELTRLYEQAHAEIARGRLSSAAQAIEAATREIAAISSALRPGTGGAARGGLRRQLRAADLDAPQLAAAAAQLRTLREEIAARTRSAQTAQDEVAEQRYIHYKFRGRSAPEGVMIDRRG